MLELLAVEDYEFKFVLGFVLVTRLVALFECTKLALERGYYYELVWPLG